MVPQGFIDNQLPTVKAAWLNQVDAFLTANPSLPLNVKGYPFNAAGDGITDDTIAIQTAVTAAAGRKLYFPSGTYLISSRITIPSYTTCYGDGDNTVIKLSVGTIDGFYTLSAIAVVVRDMKFLCAASTATGYIGMVHFHGSTSCYATNITVVGAIWSGILLWDSIKCQVYRNKFSGLIGTGGDTHDIGIYNNSNENTVAFNTCEGGGQHGIFMQDPYVGATPTGNRIHANNISGNTAYGILLYVTTQYDTQTIVTNNKIKNISGSAITGNSGAGINCQSAGGTLIAHNQLTNCCTATTNFETLGMGAISVAIGEYAGTASKQVIVAHNQINAQRGPGIYALTSDNSVLIDGNMIKSTGVAAVRGEAIIANNTKRVKIVNNDIQHANTNYYAIRITADTNEYSNHIVSKNAIKGTSAGGLLINKIGTGFAQKCKVSGNDVELTGGGVAFNIQNSDRLRFIGNQAKTDGIALSITACLKARYSDNQLQSSAVGIGIQFAGVNTGSIFDETNQIEISLMDNQAGNGTIVSQYGNAAPTVSGAWAVGDRVIQSVPVVGQPKAWRTTVAGNPATWVSEGNL